MLKSNPFHMSHLKVKEALLAICHEYVQKRISALNHAIQQAQESANSETKSSAGDKYETGRSMMQLEQEQNAKHLDEAMKLKQVLDQINTNDPASDIARLGSLVLTNHYSFFVSISIGKVEIENKEYIILSPVSPIGKTLLGKKKGEVFIFNKENCEISEIV